MLIASASKVSNRKFVKYPQVSVFYAPKDGHTQDEYEDAACVMTPLDGAGRYAGESRYAIADGATESSFAGIWAHDLAAHYCLGDFDGRKLGNSLKKLQLKWQDQISRKSLPWFAVEKAQLGAHSTLCGLTTSQVDAGERPSRGSWHALAIGDSCLFQLRDKKRLVRSFPLTESGQFDSAPDLVPSVNHFDIRPKIKKTRGGWKSGDQFLLVTDALACYLLQIHERGVPITEFTGRLQSNGSFLEFVHESRADQAEVPAANRNPGRLKNDDCTVVWIRL